MRRPHSEGFGCWSSWGAARERITSRLRFVSVGGLIGRGCGGVWSGWPRDTRFCGPLCINRVLSCCNAFTRRTDYQGSELARGGLVGCAGRAAMEIAHSARSHRCVPAGQRAALGVCCWLGYQTARHSRTHLLIVTFHHSIVDEWSARLFFDQLASLYNSGNAAAGLLDSPPPQYVDYAQWDRARSDTELARQTSYWTGQLSDVPPPLPLSKRPAAIEFRAGPGAVHPFQVPQPIAEAAETLAKQQQTTLHCVALTAFQLFLRQATTREDILVCIPTSLRTQGRWQRALGAFLNTIPIRSHVAGNLSVRRAHRPCVTHRAGRSG